MAPYKMNLQVEPVKKSNGVMKKISDSLFPFKSKKKDEKGRSFGEIFNEQMKRYDKKKYVDNKYTETLVPEIKLNQVMTNFTRRNNIIVDFNLRVKRDK
ncbi:MAG: hypothetical protein GY714_20685 [Desulfobacterales bacterium]|nr:hypothetical protein [Desulfobacterales bacterium]MCP4160591.1 hypothetical protein [Deltaproteobacteria bacterium]